VKREERKVKRKEKSEERKGKRKEKSEERKGKSEERRVKSGREIFVEQYFPNILIFLK